MSDDQFTKLFKYIQLLDVKIDGVHAELKADIHHVYGLLDKDWIALANKELGFGYKY